MKNIDAFIALNRFGLGPAPREAEIVGNDPRAWIKAQISKDQVLPAAFSQSRTAASILTEIHQARRDSNEMQQKVVSDLYKAVFQPEVLSRARYMIASQQPFVERMVMFWSNHFTVSISRRTIGPACVAYEREVIRPHVFGRFEDMLKSVCTHPCMLAYLDNIASLGSNSSAGRRRIQRTRSANTLNENLGREILELYTLGVNGGYAQNDVIELAKAISGWSYDGVRGANDKTPLRGEFEFRPEFHEPGTKTILGKMYKEDGPNEGLAVLRDLARHPSTARFIATKLVRHFVADDPPQRAVEIIAAVFLRTDGDLAAVSNALIDLDEVWRNPLAKVKTHYELVIAAHRVTGSKVANRDILQPLQEVGQMPFTAPSPQGWGDQAKDWIAPQALLRRIEWLRRFSATLPSMLYPVRLLEDALGPVISNETRTWVARAPSGDAAIAMILGSPEFQRR